MSVNKGCKEGNLVLKLHSVNRKNRYESVFGCFDWSQQQATCFRGNKYIHNFSYIESQAYFLYMKNIEIIKIDQIIMSFET